MYEIRFILFWENVDMVGWYERNRFFMGKKLVYNNY